jgi:hypothetical protein
MAPVEKQKHLQNDWIQAAVIATPPPPPPRSARTHAHTHKKNFTLYTSDARHQMAVVTAPSFLWPVKVAIVTLQTRAAVTDVTIALKRTEKRTSCLPNIKPPRTVLPPRLLYAFVAQCSGSGSTIKMDVFGYATLCNWHLPTFQKWLLPPSSRR